MKSTASHTKHDEGPGDQHHQKLNAFIAPAQLTGKAGGRQESTVKFTGVKMTRVRPGLVVAERIRRCARDRRNEDLSP